MSVKVEVCWLTPDEKGRFYARYMLPYIPKGKEYLTWDDGIEVVDDCCVTGDGGWSSSLHVDADVVFFSEGEGEFRYEEEGEEKVIPFEWWVVED